MVRAYCLHICVDWRRAIENRQSDGARAHKLTTTTMSNCEEPPPRRTNPPKVQARGLLRSESNGPPRAQARRVGVKKGR